MLLTGKSILPHNATTLGAEMNKKSWIGLAVIGVVVCSVPYLISLSQKREELKELTQKLEFRAFCKISYEIASSKPHYESRSVRDKNARDLLISTSNNLWEKKLMVDKLIDQTTREIQSLDRDENRYNDLILESIERGSLRAVEKATALSDVEVLENLKQTCERYLPL